MNKYKFKKKSYFIQKYLPKINKCWLAFYFIGLIFCIFILISKTGNKQNDDILEIHFLSLGKADCILLRFGKEAMLIDAGYEKTSEEVIHYLKKEGISVLNYAIATHGDEDHVGGMAEVIKKFQVKQLIISPIQADHVFYQNMIYSAKKRETNVLIPEVLSTFSFGEATITFLAPGKEALKCVEATNEINNSSLVLRIDYLDQGFLFMGDALHESEYEMLEKGYYLRASVIKIGHHGFSDATSKELLQTVNPVLAIITCHDDFQKHKMKENENDSINEIRVEGLLEELGILTYHTGIEGNIILYCDGTDIKVEIE